ncbi:MYCBP-associated protein [Discoglossus pictus]
MASKAGRRESRSKSSPEKKKNKKANVVTTTVQEETEEAPAMVLSGDDIQALAIRPEDLDKLHIPRPPREEPKLPTTNRILVRKSREHEEGKRRRLVVARPAPPGFAVKSLDHPGTEVPLCDTHGQIQPYSILGSLEDLKQEALTRGNIQLAQLIPDPPHQDIPAWIAEKHGRKGELQEKKMDDWASKKQDNALNNWQNHMKMRKRQLDALCNQLKKPHAQLLMNVSEDFRKVQEDRYMIDRSIPAVEHGKGNRVGSEFWNLSSHIGDELTGLTTTLTQTEKGYPKPPTYIAKSQVIKQETGVSHKSGHNGTGFTTLPPFYCAWHKSLYLQQRREDLKAIMEELHFSKPDIDGLEVIGRGHTFTSVSAEQFSLSEEQEDSLTEEKENQDPLRDFPDVVEVFVLGPSLLFCNQPAQWVDNSVSHRDKVGICTRITFEALAGDKASSVMEVENNGTASIWYEWRRLPQTSSLGGHHREPKVQRFYFNTSSGVILPGEIKNFPFYFKSPSPGIFSENWEFCTHPVLLAGALVQVSLWGIAIYEDKAAPIREALQRELDFREAEVIAQHMVEELLDRVRTPERPRTPVPGPTEEETFLQLNPKLYYKHQTMKELHQLWKDFSTPAHEEQTPALGPLEMSQDPSKETDEVPVPQVNAEPDSDWNLSVTDLKQALNSIPEDERRLELLSRLNKAITELSTPAQDTIVDILYQACLQLWRDSMDELSERSLLLRSVLGMPDKDIIVEPVVEEPVVDQKRLKGGKGERKTPVGKEDKKGKTGGKGEKEERPSSKKAKGRDEKKAVKSASGVKETKESISSAGSMDSSPSSSRLLQIDPALQEKYQENLYLEVYDILGSMVENLVQVAEGLKPRSGAMEGDILD